MSFFDKRAVSPVIGVVLMVGIVVALGAVVGGAVLGLGVGIGDTAPNTQFDASYDGDDDTLTVTHVSGDTVDSDRLSYSFTGTEDVDGRFDDEITAGDSAKFSGLDENGDVVGVTGETFEMQWQSDNGESSSVLFEYDVPAVSSSVGGNGASEPSSEEPFDLMETFNQMEQNEDGANIITNDQELQAMSVAPGEDYVLENNIDASLTENWYDNDGFEPVGDSGTAFTGTLDGQGHEISGLAIDRAGETDVGLFGVVGDGTVENVRVTDADISGGGGSSDEGTGVLAGSVLGDSQVENVHTSGVLSQTDGFNAGGLIGYINGNGDINTASSTVDVTASDSSRVGGLVGQTSADFGTLGIGVSNSYATGNVEGGDQVGGFIGQVIETSVSNSYATGNVEGGDRVGGFHGNMNLGEISNSYSAGNVEGNDQVGGFGGRVSSMATVTDSYWDIEETGQTNGIGDGSGDVTGLTTAEMTGSSAESNMDAFDFADTWETVSDDYPILQAIDEEQQLSDRE